MVDRLSAELLGRIFIHGTEEERYWRKPFSKHTSFQDIAIQVCRRWREVGLRTPELWTNIHFLNSSYPRAQFYLARVGPTRPLDIELDIQPSKSKEAVPLTRQILKYIVSHSGTIDRWRDLVVRAKSPEALFEVVAFINSSPTPILQSISLKRWIEDWGDARRCDRRTTLPISPDSHSLSSGPQRPQLSRVELFGLTCDYIFCRNSPIMSNLKELKLSCSGDLYPLHGIGELLSASLQLEYLSLDVGAARCANFRRSTTPPKVFLPSLRSLSLRVYSFDEWFEPLLKIIDAPGVESLRLSSKGGCLSLVRFLCTGRLNGVLRSKSSTSISQCGPIFPSLRRLHLDDVDMDNGFWEQFLKAYSMVTEVTLDWIGLLALVDSKTILPDLSHIRYSGDRPESFIRQLIEKGAQPSSTRVSILRRDTQSNTDAERYGLGRTLHGLVDRVEVYDDNNDFTPERD